MESIHENYSPWKTQGFLLQFLNSKCLRFHSHCSPLELSFEKSRIKELYIIHFKEQKWCNISNKSWLILFSTKTWSRISLHYTFITLKLKIVLKLRSLFALLICCLNFQERLMTATIHNSLETSLETESQTSSN